MNPAVLKILSLSIGNEGDPQADWRKAEPGDRDGEAAGGQRGAGHRKQKTFG